jgi:hypothetical protein
MERYLRGMDKSGNVFYLSEHDQLYVAPLKPFHCIPRLRDFNYFELHINLL